MSVVSKYFYDMALLSEASYVEFHRINKDYSDISVKWAVQNTDFEGRFSATQAAEFVNNWRVVDHQANTSSGFSATLFQSKGDGKFVYACRGTELGPTDLLSADAGDIVADGLALKQIVDMYNDCQRMLAPQGQAYTAMKLDVLFVETVALLAELALNLPGPGPTELALRARNDIVIDGPGLLSTVCTVTPESSATLFSDERATGSGTLTASGLPTMATGHSLGGHLVPTSLPNHHHRLAA